MLLLFSWLLGSLYAVRIIFFSFFLFINRFAFWRVMLVSWRGGLRFCTFEKIRITRNYQVHNLLFTRIAWFCMRHNVCCTFLTNVFCRNIIWLMVETFPTGAQALNCEKEKRAYWIGTKLTELSNRRNNSIAKAAPNAPFLNLKLVNYHERRPSTSLNEVEGCLSGEGRSGGKVSWVVLVLATTEVVGSSSSLQKGWKSFWQGSGLGGLHEACVIGAWESQWQPLKGLWWFLDASSHLYILSVPV